MSPPSPVRSLPRSLVLGALVVLLAACSDGPRTVHVGTDACDHCHMTVTDERFTAQLVTTRGRSNVYDAIECMAEALDLEGGVAEGDIASLWVTDYSEPGSWIRVEDAVFLRSEALRSPMGMNLSAHASEEAARELGAEVGGTLLDWSGVRALVEEHPVRGRGHSHAY